MASQNRQLKAIFPGKYIQGEDSLTGLPALVRLFGSNALILASPKDCVFTVEYSVRTAQTAV